MFKRQIKNTKPATLSRYFLRPANARQRQYEALRAVVVDGQDIEVVAERFKYRPGTLRTLLREAKTGKLELFPLLSRKPKNVKISGALQQEAVRMRNKGMSANDIREAFSARNVEVSARTVERMLDALGFPKLPRRTNAELGISQKNTLIPATATGVDWSKLKPFSIDCPVAGVFFFLPYVIEGGILDAIGRCGLPKSGVIGAKQACLSMLLLKLVGQERLSHIGRYDQEVGLGLFAGLTVLPKPTYMGAYSCRCSEDMIAELQSEIVSAFRALGRGLYSSGTINLDFHSIPHFGDESEMEKVWCGARGKAIKGANTVFAQDGSSDAVMYTRADILRGEEAEEVKRFVKYWKAVNGGVDDTLVFDCKFTTYGVLDELADDDVKFITLRKRSAALLAKTAAIPADRWERLYLPIPKRKRQHVSVLEERVRLKGCSHAFRQITVKDHGRANPTYILLNDDSRSMKDALIVYAKRWHVEQKLAEMVSFFNLNALSSPIMVRVHFDILWTLVADTLYRLLSADLRRFENCLAPTIFKKFIDMPGKVVFDGKNFQLRIRKRAHTPVLMGVEKLNKPIPVPWLDNRSIEIVWTA